MARIALSGTPQQLSGSDVGAFIKSLSDKPFMVAFSSTAPSVNDGFEQRTEMSYSGGFGAVWVWASAPYTQDIYYVVAV